jgi:hypothetical protein
MKALLARVRAIVNKPRVMHYIEIFAAAFAMAVYYNRADILGAHGLNVLGSVVFAACVAGAKAVLEAYRKSSPK